MDNLIVYYERKYYFVTVFTLISYLLVPEGYPVAFEAYFSFDAR